jgi:hypothetical protein
MRVLLLLIRQEPLLYLPQTSPKTLPARLKLVNILVKTIHGIMVLCEINVQKAGLGNLNDDADLPNIISQ